MEFGDRLMWMLFGAIIGFALGYVVRLLQDILHTVHEVDELVKQPRDEEGFMRNPKVADAAMLIVVAFTAWAAFSTWSTNNSLESNYKADKANFCQSGADNRAVQRATVEAVYQLAVGSLQRDPDSPPLTKTEVQQYNAYIDRVNDFRDRMYEQIQPSARCKGFVESEPSEPPTPPYPHVHR